MVLAGKGERPRQGKRPRDSRTEKIGGGGKERRSLVLSKLRRLPYSANRERRGALICVLPFAGGKTNVL